MSSSRSSSPNPGGGRLGGSLRAAWRRSTSFTGLSDALTAGGKNGKAAAAGGASAGSSPPLTLARSKSGVALAGRGGAALIGADSGALPSPPASESGRTSTRPPRPAPLVNATAAGAAGAAAAAAAPASTSPVPPASLVKAAEDGATPCPSPSRSASGAGPRGGKAAAASGAPSPAAASPSRAASGAVGGGAVDEMGEPLPPGVLPDGALWFEEGSTLDECYAGDAAAYAGAAAAAARVRYAAYTSGTMTADGVPTGWGCAHADPVRGRPCATPGCRGAADPALAPTPPRTPVTRLGVAVAPCVPPGVDLPFWKPTSPAVQGAMVAAACAALAAGQWRLVAAAAAPLASLSWSPGALAATAAAIILLIGAGVPEAVSGAAWGVAARARRAARAPTAAAHRVVGVIDALGTLPIILARLEVEIAAMKDDIRSIRGKADWLPSKGGKSSKGGGGGGGKAASESGGGLTAALVAAVAASAAAGVPLVPAVPPAPAVAAAATPAAGAAPSSTTNAANAANSPAQSAFAQGIMRRHGSDAEVFTWNW